MSRANGRRGDLSGLPLTAKEADALVAVVNFGGGAAAALGVPIDTFKVRLAHVRQKLGALTTTHAAALCFPDLAHRYMETLERRLGR